MNDTPVSIICFGDSITAGVRHAEGERWTVRLQQSLNRLAPNSYRVFNRGIGGQTSAQGLARILTDVVPHLPGFVLVQFGFNDAVIPPGFLIPRVSVREYQEKLREIKRIVESHNGRCIFIINHLENSPGETGNGRTYTENHADFEAGLRELVTAEKAPFIDLPAAMRERKIDLSEFLCDDGIHLSTRGAELFAEMILDGLLPLLKLARKEK